MYKDFVSLSSSQYDQNPDFSNVFVYHWHSIMEEDEEEWFSEDLKKTYFLQLASQYKQGSFFFYPRKTFLPSEMGIFSNLIMAKANPIINPTCHMCATLRVFLYIFELAGRGKLLRTKIRVIVVMCIFVLLVRFFGSFLYVSFCQNRTNTL